MPTKPLTDRIVVRLLMPNDAGMAAVDMRVARAGALRVPEGEQRVFAGVPLRTRRTARSFGEELSYVVVSVKEAGDPSSQAAADGLLNKLVLELKKRGAEEGKGAFLPVLEQFFRERRKLQSQRQRSLSSLMFYRWVVDFLPVDYWTGRAPLYEAFVVFLYSQMLNLASELSFDDVCELVAEHDARYDSEDNVRRAVQLLFFQTFVGTAAAVDLVADAFLDPATVPGLHSGKDIALAWFLIVGGILTGAAGATLVAVAIDVAIGVCQFLLDLEVIERDGEVSAEEHEQACWSFGFTFVPLLPFGLDKAGLSRLAALLMMAPLPILLFSFLEYLKECLENLIEYQKRLRVARAAGFGEYAELDLGSTIVIPLSALTRET